MIECQQYQHWQVFVGNAGRQTTIDIRPSLRLLKIASRHQRTAWLHTRPPVTWRLSLRQHIQYVLVSLSTSRCSTTRSLMRQTEPATWRRVHSMKQLPSWTRWVKRVTATQLSSCSCYETTSLSGPLTCKQMVSLPADTTLCLNKQ